ncbi:DUF4282 domain-containing protein [Nocardia sp. NBC_00511]|uniref:DUF4282 domain-containing protein n=1 Tax=Nocardia sp. NBC_00511 TaxID=2903591 RepID=UPI0030E534F4
MTNQPPQGPGGQGIPQYQPPGFQYQSGPGPQYPSPGQPAYQPVAGAGAAGEGPRGFFGSLFDFGFTSFVTPSVIKILYILAMAVAVLGALALAVLGFAVSTAVGFFTLIIVCPIYVFMLVLFYRVALEFVMVVFRMGDDMHALRTRNSAP